VTPRVRRCAAAAVLLTAAPLGLPTGTASATPVEVCNTATQEPSSLCVAYDFSVVEAGTSTPTTQSLEAMDAALHFENTSTDYVGDAGQARWLTSVSANLLSSGSIRPVVTGTAALDDGLLLAGSPVGQDCAPGADHLFSSCTAGHGKAYVISQLIGCTNPCLATFGIQRIENETENLGSHLLQVKATLDLCKQSSLGAWDCTGPFGAFKGQTQTLTIDQPAAGEPLTLDMDMPQISGAERVTIHSADILLRGRSNRLADGTTVTQQTVVRLPAQCGEVSGAGTVTAVGGTTVSAAVPFRVTGCTTLTGAPARSTLVYGASTTVSGRLVETGTATPIAGRTLVVQACPVNRACTARSATTGDAGGYSLAVTPSRTTKYVISDPVSNRTIARTVRVAPEVGLVASRTSMPSGGTVRVTGRVAPAHAGKVVRIQLKVSGVWKTIASPTLRSRSAYARTLTLRGTRGSTARLRVVLPAHADHAKGVSRTVVIRFS
jgi:hypothetical protein